MAQEFYELAERLEQAGLMPASILTRNLGEGLLQADLLPDRLPLRVQPLPKEDEIWVDTKSQPKVLNYKFAQAVNREYAGSLPSKTKFEDLLNPYSEATGAGWMRYLDSLTPAQRRQLVVSVNDALRLKIEDIGTLRQMSFEELMARSAQVVNYSTEKSGISPKRAAFLSKLFEPTPGVVLTSEHEPITIEENSFFTTPRWVGESCIAYLRGHRVSSFSDKRPGIILGRERMTTPGLEQALNNGGFF